MENNTSGQGKESEVPIEIQKWNWGAFLLSWIWGLGNNTYRAFWVFFPIVNLFMVIALGVKGSEWAWRHKKWESIEQFKEVQTKWAKAGVAFLLAMVLFSFFMVFGIGAIFKSSQAYKMSINNVLNSNEVVSRLGSPLEPGFVSGNIHTSGPEGLANLSYGIEGPKGEANVAVKAVKEMGSWSIKCLIVNYSDSKEKTIVVPCE